MKPFSLGTVITLALNALSGQPVQQAVRTDLTCVESMAVPQYDGLAWVARFSGMARVLVSVGTNGAPASIDVQSSSEPLMRWLQSSLKDARFSTQCAGQTIEVNLIYELRGEPLPFPHNKTRLKSVNTFEVLSNPPIPIQP